MRYKYLTQITDEDDERFLQLSNRTEGTPNRRSDRGTENLVLEFKISVSQSIDRGRDDDSEVLIPVELLQGEESWQT